MPPADLTRRDFRKILLIKLSAVGDVVAPLLHEMSSYNAEQEVEHQVNDDKEHHDSDDVSGVHGFAYWTSVLGKPFKDRRASEDVISPSIIDASLTSQ